jgi:hypothetical protein
MICCVQAEDNLAQAFCLVGELQLSADHCKASIQVIFVFDKPTIGWLISGTLQKNKKKMVGE